jgi:dTDP-4-dehydrorhamnose reductase
VRILITGASGFVGSHLGKYLARDHHVLGVVFRDERRLPFPFRSVDLTADKAVAALLSEFKPQVIVHAAAMSKVLDCEDRPEAAFEMNVGVTERIARGALQYHAKLIFLSSDQVFSGAVGGYRESHTPDPVNIYGRSKFEAEQAVLASRATSLIVRSNSIVGPSLGWGESFTDMVLRKLRSGEPLTLFDDQYRSPIHIRAMVRLLEAACVLEFSGLLHAGGPRRENRLATGYAVARAYGLSADPIQAASYKTHPRAGAMTADNSFDVSRLKQLMPFLEFRSLDDELFEDAQPSR